MCIICMILAVILDWLFIFQEKKRKIAFENNIESIDNKPCLKKRLVFRRILRALTVKKYACAFSVIIIINQKHIFNIKVLLAFIYKTTKDSVLY